MGICGQDVKEKLRRDFLSSYLAELAFWPAFQVVNFWKVPVRHQLLAVNMACLLDATFLCWCTPIPYSPFLVPNMRWKIWSLWKCGLPVKKLPFRKLANSLLLPL